MARLDGILGFFLNVVSGVNLPRCLFPLTGSSPALPFPCGVVPPCVDDPTFEFSGFGCDSEIFAGCLNVIEPTVLEACALSCQTCPICEEPDAISGFDVILQFAELEPGSLSVFIKTEEALASVRGVIGCFSAGGILDRTVITRHGAV